MCKHLFIQSHDSDAGIFDFTCMACGAHVEPVLNEHDMYEWRQNNQCECCDLKYDWEPTPYPDPDSKHAKSTFCSPECADEAVDQVRCGILDAKYDFLCSLADRGF